jgi:hypothetical protein
MQKAINKYFVLRDRKVWFALIYLMPIAQSSFTTRELYGTAMDNVWIIFKKERARSVLPGNKDEIGTIIARKFFENKEYYKKIKKNIQSKELKLEGLIEKLKRIDFSKASFNELVIWAEKVAKIFVEYDEANVPAWFFAADSFKKLTEEKLNISEEDFLLLSLPTKKTMASQLGVEIFQKADEIFKNEIEIKNISKYLSDKYGWLPYGFDGPEYWHSNYFEKELRKILNRGAIFIEKRIKKDKKEKRFNLKKRAELIDKNNLSEEDLRLLEILQDLAIFTDDRKKWHFQLYYYYGEILNELGRRYDIPYKNLKFLLVDELFELKDKRDDLLERSENRIIEGVVVDKNGILNKKEAEKFVSELEVQQKNSQEIKGMIASRGLKLKYQGTVKVIFSPSEENKFLKKVIF